MAAVVFIGSVAPIGVLVTWVVRGASHGVDISVPWSAAIGSLTGGTLAAVIAMIPTVLLFVFAQKYFIDSLNLNVGIK